MQKLVDARKAKALAHLLPRHIPFLLDQWSQDGVSPRTQKNYFSVLRWLWKVAGIRTKDIGTFAKNNSEYTINVNSTRDKSWSGNGIDFDMVYAEIYAYDAIGARLIKAMKVRGLRPKESLCLKPHESDTDEGLHILHGAKTGRERIVRSIDDADEATYREWLDQLKGEVPEGNHIAWQGRSLKQARERLNTICRKFGLRKNGKHGVTLYGLRHEFMIDTFETLSGEKAPVRGGIGINYRKVLKATLFASQNAGHNRPAVTGAYLGSYRSMEYQQRRNMVLSWERIEQVVNTKLTKLLAEHGIDNMYWIGDLALGRQSGQGCYELFFPSNVDVGLAGKLSGQIEDMVLSASGLQCTVQHWSWMGSARKTLWAELAVPLYSARSPLEHMKDLLDEQHQARLASTKIIFAQAESNLN